MRLFRGDEMKLKTKTPHTPPNATKKPILVAASYPHKKPLSNCTKFCVESRNPS